MESSEDVEVMSRAIEKLLDEKRKREAAGDSFIEDEDDQLLLTKLISQLESPNPFQKTLVTAKEEEESSPDSSPSKGKHQDERRLEESIEEIAKDIKEVKRQNKVTHILLSALIILTLTWQLSEYSMIYMMKERLTHPIRSIGGMFSGMFKGKLFPNKNRLQGTSNAQEENNLHNGNGTNNGVHIQVPEMLREFGFDDDDK
ncbi:Uncharacterized protein Rs2_02235 [Raphanus sativus]|uniref:Uncharacterized protein LOC108808439 n=1 Tax=Raphanus sativus TaxID=3726 RepID=A0A6J0JMM4_RAPSA|nr:uncharacterized protein LOC108808439 [Raphanus sativus]XP_056867008.1 uncharacterized protein LOC130512745 [Raphanus sativus]KAJ4865974.1 Uncharacterized protein Rs2_52508 [Raphanus sativus]KAJ4916685.1 Uncharacterized protein Rs2_02235 [Raphanus sativus]